MQAGPLDSRDQQKNALEPEVQTEQDLIHGCLQGDREAQCALFEQYKHRMYTTAYHMLHNREQAEDALQDAFVEVFRDLSQYRAESSLGGWIKTIVVRRSLRRIKLDRLPQSDNESSEVITWPDPFSGMDLAQAMQQLPAGYRAVFQLVEVEGYSHKETGHLLAISEGTSRSQLHRAKHLLRKLLQL